MHFLQIIAAAIVTANECPTSSCNPTDYLIPLPSEIKIASTPGFSTKDGPVDVEVDAKWTDFGDEGYVLSCHQEGFRLTARTQRGHFYGMQTLSQIKRIGLIPCCTITDKPKMGMRAVMFDLARLKEKHEYYYHMIDQLAQWKINTVFLHVTDHSGCALEIKAYPGLATPYAFTQAEMRDMIKYAQDRHIELIPEVEPWGHAKYITTRPEFADLAEDPKDPRALCTSNPRTWEVLRVIFGEVAKLFPSKYLHAGCDEASFGKCPKCVAKAEKDGKDALVGEHLTKVCEIVKEAGKIPMIWGDVLLHYRGSADFVPKDAIVTHWDYKADLSPEPVQFLKEKGFAVLGCPAVVWGSRMILPMADTLDNCMNYAKIVLDNNCIGMDTTIWVPQRYITDTLNFALAYASELSWSGIARPRIDFANAFARNYFGVDVTGKLAQSLLDMHQMSEKSFDKLQNLWKYAAEAEKLSADDLNKNTAHRLEVAAAVGSVLTSEREHVTLHQVEYDALMLAADTSRHMQERAITVHKVVHAVSQAKKLASDGKTAEASQSLRDCAAVLSHVKTADDALRHRLETTWDRWRYADDPRKKSGGENMMEGFQRSAYFLTTVPLRLRAAADSIEKGGAVDWDAMFRQPKDQEEKAFVDAGDVTPPPTK